MTVENLELRFGAQAVGVDAVTNRIEAEMRQLAATAANLNAQMARTMTAFAGMETTVKSTGTAVAGATERTDGMRRSMGSLEGSFISTRGVMTGFIATMAGFLVGSEIRRSFEFAASLTELSRAIGVTVEQYQILNRAAIENGASTEGMTRAMGILNRTLGQARAGVPAAVESFRALRIDPEQFRNAGEVLPRVMEAIKGLRTEAEQAAAAQRLLGRGATELIPFLVQGAAGYDQAAESARRMGLLTQEQTDRADEAEDQLAALALTLRTKLAIAIADNIPKIVGLINGLAGLVTWAANAANSLAGLATQLTVVGGLLGLRFGPWGAAAGAVIGHIIGQSMEDSAENANMNVEFRQQRLAAARRELAQRETSARGGTPEGSTSYAGGLITVRREEHRVQAADPNDDGSLFRIRRVDPNARQDPTDTGAVRAARAEVARQEGLLRQAQARPTTPPPVTPGNVDLDLSGGGGSRGGGSGMGQVQIWERELRRTQALSGEFFRDTTADELAFWQERLTRTREGSDDWYEIQERIYQLSRRQAQENFQEQVADLDAQIQANRGNYEQMAAIEQRKVDLIRETFGEQSREYRAAIREQERMVQAHNAELLRLQLEASQRRLDIARQTNQTDLAFEQASFQAQRNMIEYAVNAGYMGRVEAARRRAALDEAEFSARRAAAERDLQLQLEFLRAQLQIAGLSDDQRRQINANIERVQQDHFDSMRRMDADYNLMIQRSALDTASAVRDVWMERLAPISDALTQMVNGFLTGSMTLRQAVLSMGSSILQAVNSWLVRWITMHIAGEQAKTAATAAGAAARTSVEAGAMATGMAMNAASATTEITTHGAVAAAGALRAVSHIPVIGPFIAPAIAAGILALAMSFIGKIASAEGGMGSVPYDGMLTELHKDEMVLPSDIASPLRAALMGGNWSLGSTGLASRFAADMGVGSGGGPAAISREGDVHLHLQAMDGRSARRFLMDNRAGLADALRSAARDNV